MHFSALSIRGLLSFLCAICLSSTAWAAIVQTVELVGEGAQEIPGQTISFAPATGEVENIEVVESEDDDRIFVVVTLSDDATTEGTMSFGEGDTAFTVATPAVGAGETLSIDVGNRIALVSSDNLTSTQSAGIDPFQITRPTWGIHFGAGVREVDVPEIGIGLRFSGDLEGFAISTSDKAEGTNYTGSIGYTDPNLGGLAITIDYFEDDDDFTELVPSGTDVTGNVNIDFNPNDNTTGILYGASGLDIQAETELERWSIGFTYFPQGPWKDLPGGIEWFPTAEFTRLDYSIGTWASPPAFGGDITDTRTYDLELNTLDVGVRFVRPFYLDQNWKLWPEAEIMAHHANLELDAREIFSCAICGSDASFDTTVSDEDDVFGVTGGFGVGLGYLFDTRRDGIPNAMAFVRAAHRVRSNALGVFVPSSGDDLFIDDRILGVTDDGDFNESTVQFGLTLTF